MTLTVNEPFTTTSTQKEKKSSELHLEAFFFKILKKGNQMSAALGTTLLLSH